MPKQLIAAILLATFALSPLMALEAERVSPTPSARSPCLSPIDFSRIDLSPDALMLMGEALCTDLIRAPQRFGAWLQKQQELLDTIDALEKRVETLKKRRISNF